MNHLFVPYSTALKLTKKGYNETCLKFYNSNKSLTETKSEGTLLAPLYQQAIDWIRELKDINIYIKQNRANNTYLYFIEHQNGVEHGKPFHLYHEALAAGIEGALELM